MRIDQILPSFGFYDAIGTENRCIRDLLQKKGIESEIFAEEGVGSGEWRHVNDYQQYASPDNYIIYHCSIGSLIPYHLMGYSSKLITRYHNITPAKF